MRTRTAPLIVALVLFLSACGSVTKTTTAEQPLIAKDINGTTITIPAKAPQRIVSLGATESEILGALNLADRVVGVDFYTDYPASLASKTKVDDASLKYNVEQIISLSPDLILSFGGETSDTDKELLQHGLNVVDVPPLDLAGSLTEIRLVGQLTHTEDAANALVSAMQTRIDAVKTKVSGAAPVTVYMEVGYDPPPPYAFGGASFGNSLIEAADGKNIFGDNTTNLGFPQVSVESIIAANPQVIILTEDPMYGGDPAKVAQRPGWDKIQAVQQHHVYAIDPNIVQRPGPRLVDALDQIAKDLHPELFS
jgi:iron complex transport system substrate-binding protein